MARAPKEPANPAPPQAPKDKVRREIQGNLPYLNSPNALKNVLQKIVTASVPDKFSQDYLSTILGYSGGSYRMVIPILKRVGLLGGDGKPTELYSRFRTEGGRPMAAYQALRTGYAELFKRNEHAYAAADQKLVDLIVEVTGLPKTDQIVGAIKSTFRIFSGLLPAGFSPTDTPNSEPSAEPDRPISDFTNSPVTSDIGDGNGRLNLAYNINIVLPDTRDIEVFNAIFRSVRDNLLK